MGFGNGEMVPSSSSCSLPTGSSNSSVKGTLFDFDGAAGTAIDSDSSGPPNSDMLLGSSVKGDNLGSGGSGSGSGSGEEFRRTEAL